MRRMAYESNLGEFDDLKEQYKNACRDYEDVQDEVSRILILLIIDKVYLTATFRVGVGFSVKPISLRVLLPVRTTENLKLEKNLT